MKFQNTTTEMLAKYLIVTAYCTDFNESVVILTSEYDDYVEFLKEWHAEDLIKVTKSPFKRYSKCDI